MTTAKKSFGWPTWPSIALCGVILFGCTTGAPPTQTDANNAANSGGGTKTLKVGMVLDKGGLGDKSFNDSAHRGLEQAKSELGVETNFVESKTDTDYETNLESYASQGYDLVVGVGIGMEDAIKNASAKYPNVNFVIVDGAPSNENVRSIRFKEEEGSFLAGYLAASMSKTGKLGFVGGQSIDLIRKFQYGFMAGAKYARKDIEILGAKFTDSWDSTDKGKAAAKALYSDGADVVYHAAGRAGLGVFKAAEEANMYAIGVDSDQDDLAEGRILSSMIKNVDVGVVQTIKDLKDGKFSGGEKVYDLASGGVGLSEMRFTKDMIGEGVLKGIESVKAEIVSGKIMVPATEKEYTEFLTTLP